MQMKNHWTVGVESGNAAPVFGTTLSIDKKKGQSPKIIVSPLFFLNTEQISLEQAETAARLFC